MSHKEHLAAYLADLVVIDDFLDDRGVNDPRLAAEAKRVFTELLKEVEHDQEHEARANPEGNLSGGSGPNRPSPGHSAVDSDSESTEPRQRLQGSPGPSTFPPVGVPRKA